MESYSHIVIGTDGSADAAAAVDNGALIAARLGVPARIVTVWNGDSKVPESDNYEWAAEVTEHARTTVERSGVADITAEQLSGKADDVLLSIAGEHQDALILIGGKGLTSRTSRMTGSVANRLSHHSPADVLFAHLRLPDRVERVALTTDGSATSRMAVRRGLALTLALGAEPHLVTVAKDQEEGERLMSAAIAEFDQDEPDVRFEHDILIGVMPGKTLVDAATDYDLMVMGNRSMSGASRLRGSIANKVTHGVESNLLLVNTSSV